ncbi:lipopolysaccharide biosynthesis protein [Methylolobus aquaticus]
MSQSSGPDPIPTEERPLSSVEDGQRCDPKADPPKGQSTDNSPAAGGAPSRVFRNAAAQIGGRGLYLLTRVALPPFILEHISLQEYGIWATCFLLIGYIGMGTFGIAGVYIRYSAEYYARGEMERIGRLVGAGILLTGTVSAALIIALYACMPILFRWFHIEPELQGIAGVSILSVIGAMLLDLLLPYGYVLQGIHRNAEQTIVNVLSFLLETALIVVFLLKGWGLAGLLAAYVLRSIFALMVMLAWFPRILPGFRIRFRGLGRDEFRLFYRYGGALQLIGVIAMFLNTSERAIAGYLTKGVGSVGLLDIGQKFPVMISQIFNAATNTYLSAFTHLHSLDQHQELQRLYVKSSRYLNLLNGLAMGFLAPFALALITAWMGKSIPYEEAGTVLLYAALGFHVQALTGPATTYAQATHRVGATLWWFLLPQGLVLAGALAWILMRGTPTVLQIAEAAMWSRITSSVFVLIYTVGQLKLSFLRYMRDVVLVGALPYGIGYALAYGIESHLDLTTLPRLHSLGVLALTGAGYLVLTLGLLIALMSTREERQHLGGLLTRRLSPRRA